MAILKRGTSFVNIWQIWIPIILLFLICPSSGLIKPTSVKLVNNEYTGVVIAIHEDEPESDDLIEVLVNMVRNASSYLYRTTKHRAFFKEVMILIPDSWGDREEYQSPRNSTYEGADIIVAARNPRFAPDPSQPAIPYTKHYEGCGKMGVHIHLTSEFLLNEKNEEFFGEKGRILVHEWAHYRWGLFDEYPDPIPAKQFYYSTGREKWLPIRCTTGYEARNVVFDRLLGKFRDCALFPGFGYEFNCTSMPSPTQPSVTASILSGYQKIEQIADFCDDDDHNAEAPNKHNRLCDSRSAWNVMREHEDFKNGNNPPREVDDVTPTIILAKKQTERVVLVLDSSGSMDDNNRIEKLASKSQDFLRTIAVDGSFVGIVDFDSVGKYLSGLTLIDSQSTRDRLARLIPTSAEGGTCIGNGLEVALQILSENGQSPAGGRILLITDGEDQCDDPLATERMRQRLINEGVVVDSVSISDKADAGLERLSHSTGGRSYHQTDDATSVGLHDAFVNTMKSGVKKKDRRVEIYRNSFFYEVGASKNHRVFIDETVGNRTTFEFAYFVDSSPAISITVTSPSGTEYDSGYSGYSVNTQFKVVSVKFETAEPGLWQFTVLNHHSAGHEVLAVVYTYPSRDDVEPITATSELSGLTTDFANGEPLVAFAEVRQGLDPVIRAQVTATIERPPDKNGIVYGAADIELLDNGAGADVTKDDGIYSRYYTDFTGIGVYGISMSIESNENTLILDNDSRPYSRTLAYVDPEELLKGNIPTIGNTTLLLPGMPVPPLTGKPAPKFTRGISGGSSRVPETPENWEPGVDIIPPNKILDLSVTGEDYEDWTVTLEFTAPGNDLDNGNASLYVIRKAVSSEELLANYSSLPVINQTHIRDGKLDSPGQFGDRERFVIQVDVPQNQSVVSYIFAMHAVDEAGNAGGMSNLALATLRKPPPTPTPPTSPMTTTDEITTPTPEPKRRTALWIFLFVIVVLLVIVIIYAIYRYVYRGGQSANKKVLSDAEKQEETEKAVPLM